MALIDNQAGLDAYHDSPAHSELVARTITPRLATREALQLGLRPEWLGWSDG